jgi:endogenous inhibitor of DNA gyrase (YacG/DUF329 family)
MQRTERYCDICGKQMTYRGSDGYTTRKGIMLSEDKIIAGIQVPNDCGSTASQVQLEGKDFCSVTCLSKSVDLWVERIVIRAEGLG